MTQNKAQALAKRAYHTPQIQRFGDVSELTLTSSDPNNGGADGGSLPNGYAS